MSHRIKSLILIVFMLAFLRVVPPAHAQEDVGSYLEREYGVVGRDTEERRKMNDDLDRIVEKMSGALGYRPKSAKILGGKDPKTDREINALALPDGRIYVLVGLITAASKTSDPEASEAFVVGHEITHVVKRHSKAQMKQSILGALGGNSALEGAGRGCVGDPERGGPGERAAGRALQPQARVRGGQVRPHRDVEGGVSGGERGGDDAGAAGPVRVGQVADGVVVRVAPEHGEPGGAAEGDGGGDPGGEDAGR